MDRLYRHGLAHKHCQPSPSAFQHQTADKQSNKIDIFGAPTASSYQHLLSMGMSNACLYDEQMYPTPPLTASIESEDGDSSGTSACPQDGLLGEDCPGTNPFPRISKPVELLRDSYDCVVIGSGYGGSVAASRMARAGESVCLLERGEERWPGEYPTTTMEAAKQFRLTGDFTPSSFGGVGVDSGNTTGMYHLFFGRDQSALVGNGT